MFFKQKGGCFSEAYPKSHPEQPNCSNPSNNIILTVPKTG